MLERGVGPGGRVTGVDFSDAMLNRARRRVLRHGWSSVELVQSDAASYEFRPPVDGLLSTYALVLVPRVEDIYFGFVYLAVRERHAPRVA
jgi:demethylmenaquinone methyltransferase/2-methoxy-6-polyprenyl-1,4-benzoquinol methylase